MVGTVYQDGLNAFVPTAALGTSVVARLATSADDAELRDLLRMTPLGGQVSLSLECEPSLMDAVSVEGDRHDVIVLQNVASERLCGMGTRSVREVYVNGRVRRVGYLARLRLAPGIRRSRRVLAAAYAFTRSLHRPDEAAFDLTSLVADNSPAVRLLTADLPGLPHYKKLVRLTTLVIPTRRRIHPPAQTHTQIRRGCGELAEAIVACLHRNNRRFQFAPRWTKEDVFTNLESHGLSWADFHVAIRQDRLVGCLAMWDQRAFKQVIVRAYAPFLRRLRPWINIAATLTSSLQLPAPGRALRLAYASLIAIDDDDPDILLGLLVPACRRMRDAGVQCVGLGLASGNPLLDAARRSVSHRAFESDLYVVEWTGNDRSPVLLDDRPVHVEAALL